MTLSHKVIQTNLHTYTLHMFVNTCIFQQHQMHIKHFHTTCVHCIFNNSDMTLSRNDPQQIKCFSIAFCNSIIITACILHADFEFHVLFHVRFQIHVHVNKTSLFLVTSNTQPSHLFKTSFLCVFL